MDASRRIPCSREALVLALGLPFLCLHQRYNPNFTVTAGGTSVDVALSDVAMVFILIAAGIAGRRLGIDPLRRGGWTLVAATALIGIVLAATLAGPALTTGYPLGDGLVSASKFAEYGLLVVAVPLIVRRRGDALAVAIALTAIALAAAIGGLLQMIGLLGNLDNVPAGRRMPSFLGYHDFAALAGATLGVAIATIASGSWQRLRALGAMAAVAGVIGVVVAGAMTTVLALWLAVALAMISMIARGTFSLRRSIAIGGLVLATTLGTLSLRSGDVADFVGFLGKDTPSSGQIESYSQRTVLSYIGLKIFLAHPLTGVGWQASELPVNFEPQLDAAHRRFPDVAPGAFPSDEHRWGIQNAYVQAGADLGIVGLLALLATLAGAFLRAAIRGLRGVAPPGPIAIGVAIGVLVCAAEWAALGLVPGIPATALLWLFVGGAVALPRGGDLPAGASEAQ